MATVVPPPSKKQRREQAAAVAAASTSSQPVKPDAPAIVVQFTSSLDGSALGPPVRLPADTDRAGLELLANQLRKTQRQLNRLQRRRDIDGSEAEEDGEDDDDEPTPYSFHVALPSRTGDGRDNDAPDKALVIKDLQEVIRKHENVISTEDILNVVCEPEAVFKVRQITRCSSTLSGHDQPILCASFSPTGNMLATGSGDNTVRLWDLGTELPKASLVGHTGWVLCLEWNGLETALASGSHDNTIRLWDPKTGKGIGEPLKGHTKWITGLAWEPIHLNAAEPRLASASKDGSVRVWQPKARRLDFALGGHTASVNAVRWGGDGIIYTASSDRTVRLWNSETGKPIRTLSEHGHWVNTLALNTDFILRTGPFDHVTSRVSSNDDARAKALAKYKAFTAQQPELLISGSDDHTLFLWPNARTETNPKKPLARLTGHRKMVNHVAFSPDGRWIASAGWDNSVKLWDGRTGKFIASLRGHVAAVYRVSFSSDSRLLVSASKDSTLKLWNLRTQKLQVDLPGHTDEVYCVDFVADKVASGGRDKTVKIWKN